MADLKKVNWRILRKQMPYFYMAFSFAILLCLFLWNEHIDTTKKINDQKVANFFVTVFTVVGTISAIYYTKKQYELTEKTTLINIKPDFTIDTKEIVIEQIPSQSNKTLSAAEHHYFIELKDTINQHEDVSIEIKNEGLGIAKNVFFDWHYNQEELAKFTKDYFLMRNLERPVFLKYIQAGAIIHISPPLEYLCCCAPKMFEVYEKHILTNIGGDNGTELPDLSLEIHCTDLHGNNRSEKFNVETVATLAKTCLVFSKSLMYALENFD